MYHNVFGINESKAKVTIESEFLEVLVYLNHARLPLVQGFWLVASTRQASAFLQYQSQCADTFFECVLDGVICDVE